MVPVITPFEGKQEPKMGGFYPKKQPKTILSIKFPVLELRNEIMIGRVLTSIVKNNL
ncbi:hypothetical protein L1276_002622 [Flavobacterium sp. HSC-32F16]|nr:hypothetical protein [Flavobacterium sp. HSC-32F16]